MNSPVLSRLRRARWVHGLQLLVFTCWVANPFPGALSYWTDSNQDGVKEEVANPTEGDSWFDQDSDGDGLSNAQEALYGSDPYAIDSDHDGLRDDAEQALSDPTAPFDPWKWSSDDSGFSDHDQLYQRLQGYTPVVNYHNLAAGSFFSYSDADGDAVKNPDDSDPFNCDRDGDGILNWHEAAGQMDDATNGYVPPPPEIDPGVVIGGNWYPTGTLDSDGDGNPDHLDPFPYGSFWYNGAEYGGAWNDRDSDSIPDAADPFPDGSYWYNGIEYGGVMQDQDGDGLPDPMDPWPTIAGSFWWMGSEYPGAWSDQDGDGVPDVADPTPNGSFWWNGLEYLGPWVDQDGDGTPDAFDSWPTIAGSYTYNGTEYPGSITDSDGDGLPDMFDPYPYGNDPIPEPTWVDSDGDGIPDYNDATPNGSYWYNGQEYAGTWSDADSDSIPDSFDGTPNGGYWYGGTEYAGSWSDMDGDLIPDPADATPNGGYWYNGSEYAGAWSDVDNDGIPDGADGWPNDEWNGAPHYTYNGSEYPGDINEDRDSDTIPDTADAYPDDNENNADNDSDGLSNYAERTQHNTNPDSPDTDGEGLTDYEELYTYHTDPLLEKTNPNQPYSDYYTVDQTDGDGDQIPDRIEQWYANQGYGMSASDPLDAAGDLDGDGYTNLQAYHNGWSFVANLNHYDNDQDGILDVLEDAWSTSYPGILSSSNPDDAVLDYDGDGLMNFEEIALSLNPGIPNSRIAGVHDLQEWAWRGIIYGTGVIVFSGSVPPEWNAVTDTDHSGAPDGLEAFVAALNANPALVALPQRQAGSDYDGDTMTDVWEYRYHLNLRDAQDAQGNNDGDSLTNLQEFTSNPPRDPLVNDDPPPPVLTLSAAVPNGAVGEAYSATFTASGGTGTYTYGLTYSTLPEGLSGLSLDASSGVISGTPMVAGTYDLWVQVSDSAGQTASTSYGVTIAGLEITTEVLPPAEAGADYAAPLAVIHGTAPYDFNLFPSAGDTGLPIGYTLSNGMVLGVGNQNSTALQQPDTFVFTVQVTDHAGRTATKQLSLTMGGPPPPPPLTITTTTLPPAGAGWYYAAAIQVTGSQGDVAFSADALPPGMTFDNTGMLSGTVPKPGTYVFNVTAQEMGANSQVRIAHAALTLVVAYPEMSIISGDEQIAFAAEPLAPLVVRLSVGGMPLPGTVVTFNDAAVTTNASGLATWTGGVAPVAMGVFNVTANGGGTGLSFTLASAGPRPVFPQGPTIPATPVLGAPLAPVSVALEDAEVKIESRWVSANEGSVNATYSSGFAYGVVNGQFQMFYEPWGPPPYARDGARWKASNDSQEHTTTPPAPSGLGDDAWVASAAAAGHRWYADTEAGPVEGSELGSSSSQWPAWTDGPGAVKLYGGWYGSSHGRHDRTTVEVRLKRVGGGTGAVSRSFIAITEEDGVIKSVEAVPPLVIAEGASESETTYPLTVSASAPGKAATKRLLPIEVRTETIADQPANRDRKKIGIGEEVRLDITSPADAQVTWALKAGSHGQLVRPIGYPANAILFTASEQEKPAEIEVTLTNYQNAKSVVTFNVITPKSITFEKTEGPGIAIDDNPAGIRMEFKADWYYGPDDVCFYNVVGGETAAPAVRTGCFLDDPDTDQPHTTWIGGPGGNLTKTVTQGKGTKCQTSDGIRLGRWQPPAIDKTGRCEWNLQWKYRLKWGSGEGTPFAPVTQWMEVISGQGFNGFNGKGGKGNVNVP